MIFDVVLSKQAKAQLKRAPKQVVEKLRMWVLSVELEGLENVRKLPGYHDEPLSGSRKGQRSIRLNRAYRAIYEVRKDEQIEFVRVEEVNKHDY